MECRTCRGAGHVWSGDPLYPRTTCEDCRGTGAEVLVEPWQGEHDGEGFDQWGYPEPPPPPDDGDEW